MRTVLVASVCLMALSLSSCLAYDAASTAVHVTGTVVGTAADVAGYMVTAPFGGSDSHKKKDDN